MPNYLLTIMIPTTIHRKVECDKLEFEIWKQIERDSLKDLVNVIIDDRGKDIPIGQKRNDMYNHPEAGDYSWQIDDDDFIHDEALAKIIDALDQRPDAVTFLEDCYFDGVRKISNHSIWYDEWKDNWDGYDYVRCAYFKDVIKTELARKVTVPFIRWNEDEQFSMLLKPYLETEVHINEFIYIYQHVSSDSTERYGLNL